MPDRRGQLRIGAGPNRLTLRLSMSGGADDASIVTLRGQRPPILAGDGVRGLVMPVMAAVAWSAALLREQMVPTALDAIRLVIEILALAITVRALTDLVRLARRLRVAAAAPRQRLELDETQLRYVTAEHTIAIAKTDIVDIREEGNWTGRSAGRRYSHVYVTLVPTHRERFLSIPPIFDDTPGVLAERLMRWRGALPALTVDESRETLASKVYDEAAAGNPRPDDIVIRHGHGWLARGPYTSSLLGVLLLYSSWKLPELMTVQFLFPWITMPTIAALLFAWPLGWIAFSWRHVGPRKGLALVLTRSEVLMRIRSGILRTKWSGLERVTIDTFPAWSVLNGFRHERVLIFVRREHPPIRYEEAYLGVPAEVVAAWCEAYLRGVIAKKSELAT